MGKPFFHRLGSFYKFVKVVLHLIYAVFFIDKARHLVVYFVFQTFDAGKLVFQLRNFVFTLIKAVKIAVYFFHALFKLFS